MNDLECLACVIRVERFNQTLKAWKKDPDRLEVFDPDREEEPEPPRVFPAVTRRAIISPTHDVVVLPSCRGHVLVSPKQFGLPDWKQP